MINLQPNKLRDYQSKKARSYSYMLGLCIVVSLSFLVFCISKAFGFVNPLSQFHPPTNSDQEIHITADTVSYEKKKDLFTAEGGVEISFDSNQVKADYVEYSPKNGRIFAKGHVCVIKPNGDKIYADHFDISNNTGLSSAQNLRIQTKDDTHLKATHAQRIKKNNLTILENASYTACESCLTHPNRPVIWEIRAKKVIWDQSHKTLEFRNSSFDFFGIPLFFIPKVKIADPTIKRKSGFLFPSLSGQSYLGYGVSLPYFWNLAPNYDLTFTESFFLQQGLLSQIEWRHLISIGEYRINLAYIYQRDPSAFPEGSIDQDEHGRFSFGTQGTFFPYPQWELGWNLLYQTDNDFAKSYHLHGYNEDIHHSRFYLHKETLRNYFNIDFYSFLIQDSSQNSLWSNEEQPLVLPSIHSLYLFKNPVYGGQLSWHNNAYLIYRQTQRDISKTYESAGTHTHLNTELEWKKNITTRDGLVLTPMAALRADLWQEPSTPTDPVFLKQMPAHLTGTIGMQVAYPILAQVGSAEHIFEPVLQIFSRNNEGLEGIKYHNEDAQSFVFDATNLLSRDKFSGYDRVEGGTRANLALRYLAMLSKGWSLEGILGQSYHIAGLNSFALPDPSGLTLQSGLDKPQSDYVAYLGANNQNGFLVNASTRIDNINGKLHHLELQFGKMTAQYGGSIHYAYSDKQPAHGYYSDRQEIGVNAYLKLTPAWWINGNTVYDLNSQNVIAAGGGIRYQDECFGIDVNCERNKELWMETPSYRVGFHIGLRTLTQFPIS